MERNSFRGAITISRYRTFQKHRPRNRPALRGFCTRIAVGNARNSSSKCQSRLAATLTWKCTRQFVVYKDITPAGVTRKPQISLGAPNRSPVSQLSINMRGQLSALEENPLDVCAK